MKKIKLKLIILNFENYADGLQSYITQFWVEKHYLS